MKTFVNLLSLEYRRKELLRRRLLQWSLVWTLCAAAGVGLWWLAQSRYRASLGALEGAEQAYTPLEKLVRQTQAMQEELEQHSTKGTILSQLRDERPLLTVIGVVSQAARRCDGRLVVHDLSFQRHNQPAQTRDKDKAKGAEEEPEEKTAEVKAPWASVTLKGEALDNLAVATFVVSLRDSGLFRRVELKSSVGNKSSKPELRSYVLECDI